ncbi:MAG: hypothetical protein FWC57_05025 [Endomicrobia bacterium]|nr:hypothetical protein [Endomicrobiia bacterium]
MPQHKKELIKFAVEKSKTALQTAKENIASKKLEGALNRIYESSFAYRQKSDYDLTYIPDLDTVQTLLSKAEFFIDAIIKTI